jgi:hypothetical protein
MCCVEAGYGFDDEGSTLLRYMRVVCDATDDALLMKSFDCLQNIHISKVPERERRRNASSIPNFEYAQRFIAASAYW